MQQDGQEWLQTRTDVSGVEGVLIKPLNSRYLPGHRGWTKIRRRDTTEAIVGAITGTLTRPQLLVVGRHDRRRAARGRPDRTAVPGRRPAGRWGHLTEAAPGHPWTGVKLSATRGSRAVRAAAARPDAQDEDQPVKAGSTSWYVP
ncbi:hypothetical protein [Streptomyces sp. Sge12]|uniref:hypothetical protein n=1 Tax=Streptomyces sp. Sge12 TaxID=1972846 RepID=UPI0013311D69|nr:hypothetical protein [Streptomyces sp. Sge12]